MCNPFAGFFLRNCPKREREQERIVSLLDINRQNIADAIRRTLQDFARLPAAQEEIVWRKIIHFTVITSERLLSPNDAEEGL